MCLKKYVLLGLFVLFSALVYAQDSDITTSIDQALKELNNIEQNQIALKLLLTERETTIAEKEQLLIQMTHQFQNLEASYLLLKNVNKADKAIMFGFGFIIMLETFYIVGDTVLKWW